MCPVVTGKWSDKQKLCCPTTMMVSSMLNTDTGSVGTQAEGNNRDLIMTLQCRQKSFSLFRLGKHTEPQIKGGTTQSGRKGDSKSSITMSQRRQEFSLFDRGDGESPVTTPKWRQELSPWELFKWM
ncbi:hypothetical protein IW261DRAFT_1419698 [Armillaria novae-zelandiae]|uniref:Uncharacterized protein n=1 Tax=Armillaria novae-zelandiae TaxID=153914 RepID=A0AA39U827_9AGAR|nr:hypothetical protein IW261DRAFT_1419698 [Armillaria novae-zelandiae]